MSKIILFIVCLFFILPVCAQNSVAEKITRVNSIPNSTSPVKKDSGIVIRLRCSGTLTTSLPPLFVVDGIPYEEKDFSALNLNPNDIKSIDILKEAAINALYGCNAPRGVVIITTKKADERTILVKDFLSNETLSGASITFISRNRDKETVRMISDMAGKIFIQNLLRDQNYEMIVSYSGYKTYTGFLNSRPGKTDTIFLEREHKQLREVKIRSMKMKIGVRNLSEGLWGELRCLISGLNVTTETGKNENTVINSFGIKIFPNPAIRSGNVNLEFNSDKQSKRTIQLFSIGNCFISGKEYVTKEGNNKLSFSIDPRLSAGIYFLQAIDEKGKLIRTEKLVIQ